MNKPACFANRLREICRKRDHIVIRRLFDLVDAFDRKLSTRLDLFQRVARDRAHLCVDLADRDFHVEPFLKLVLLRPERAHFGQCVPDNHCLVRQIMSKVFISSPLN